MRNTHTSNRRIGYPLRADSQKPKRTHIPIAIALMFLLTGFLSLSPSAFAKNGFDIKSKHHSMREMQLSAELEEILKKYDVSKYTFTRKVIIEERAMNHAFPDLTLNVHYLGSDDELLSSYLHEQLHWHLRDHRLQMERAMQELQTLYPKVPVGLPESADTVESTYAHLVDCYLEIQADRQIIGPGRTDQVIKNKPWYTWIYKTITRDEKTIADIVNENHLEIQ
jgi:hypothetical protein